MARKLTHEQREQRALNLSTAREVFEEYGGQFFNGYPAINSPVFHTENGTPYLKRPGVVMVARTNVELRGLGDYLSGYDSELGFGDYLNDPVVLEPAAQLVKLAGQECYASYGPNRTMNSEADDYLKDIKNDEHGSVLMHPNFSFLIYGISRSVSHEWVRHGSGHAYSQRSQRYVSGKVLRFVERPEYQLDPELHEEFKQDIEATAANYEKRTQKLLARQADGSNPLLAADAKTDKRKRVQQTSRSVLTNETETSFVWTVNARAIQHTENMRSSEHAEVEIREPFLRVMLCLMMAEPNLFADFEIVKYPDGTRGAQSPYKKP